MENDPNIFAKDYSEESFWEKTQKFAKTAGKEVIETSVQLYYAMQSPNTPTWAKSIIIGALGYFISPVDAIPDIVPLVGFADDLGVLTMAAATVVAHITDDVKAKAAAQTEKWFG
jgi:uncharacterized membrane protein YkvA (DUF1232 family)